MSQYTSSDSVSNCSEFSSSSSSSSEEEEDESVQNSMNDPDFIGIMPHRSLNHNTFLYDIAIEVNMTSNQRKAHFKRDCVRTVLLVILGQVFHEHEAWKQIGVYLMQKFEDGMEVNGSWTTDSEKKNRHVYQGKLQISGHCTELKGLATHVPVVYEQDINADFAMLTNGKTKQRVANQRVTYRASIFLSPALKSANKFYADHGFVDDNMTNVEGGQETQKCLKLYLKNIMKNQRKFEGTRYDNQLAWKTVFDAMREVREDPNYELSGNESPVYYTRYRSRR